MPTSRGKNAVLVAAALGACAYVLLHRARSWWEGEGRWSDGSSVQRTLADRGVRHAVWDVPAALPATVNTAAAETRPALSPDGRWLVFAAGERGADAGLFAAELVGGVPEEPRRIAELDTPDDELAPAFSASFLYFASERTGGAGGLDLWRAPYRDGVFGPPERLPETLQTARDDTDPSPSADDTRLVFASDRGGDFDLYAAELDGAGAAAVRIDELASPAAERDPCLGSDGGADDASGSRGLRALTFASERAGSFDLYRSTRERDRWSAPVPLEGLNTPDAERGPATSPDGFGLWFERSAAGAPADLFHARSREIFAIPGRPWTWFDTAVVASLALLALMAFLAGRWPVLDLLYKCLLVSVLLHLLLLYLLQYFFLGAGAAPLREGARFRIRLVPSTTGPSALTERAGRIGPRAEAEVARPERAATAEVPDPAPSALAVEARLAELPAGPEPTAPERGRDTEVPAADAATASVALSAPEERVEVREATAPALELAAAEAAPVARSDARPEPSRATGAPGTTPAEPAHALALEAPRDSSSAEPARSATERVAPTDAGGPPVVVAVPDAPDASGARRRAERAPGLALSPRAVAGAASPEAPSRAPADARGDEPDAVPGRLGALVSPAVAGSAGELSPIPARTDAERAEPTGPGAGPQVRVASEPVAPANGGARAARAPELELGSVRAVTPARPGTNPERASIGAASAPERAGAPAPGPLALTAPSAAADAPGAPARSSVEPDARGPGSAPAVDLADRAQPVERRASGGSGPEDLLADLPASAAPPRDTAGRGPERARLDAAPSVRASADAPAESPLARAPEPDRAPPPLDRRPWDQTPYENRSPEQRARALQLHGGDATTEVAVEKGLAYLARIQRPAGNWGRSDDRDPKYGEIAVGKTGLALLAFLGAGHTHRSGTRYSPNVQKALEHLQSRQDAGTGHFGEGDAYSHGIAAYAVAECVAMTGDAELKRSLVKAIDRILAAQDRHADPRLAGGWSYYYADGHVYDRWPRTSIVAWQIMALESARLSGIAVDDAVFEAARAFLEHARDEEQGVWRYNHDPERLADRYSTLPASTPAGMFALSLMGADLASAEYGDLRRFVLQRRPNGYRYAGDDEFVFRGTGNLYFWYYGTLAMFRAGGASWQTWNEGMKSTLVPAQAEDGSWEPIDPYARYARDRADDKSYTTALCILSLEIYYRYYLPLLKVK